MKALEPVYFVTVLNNDIKSAVSSYYYCVHHFLYLFEKPVGNWLWNVCSRRVWNRSFFAVLVYMMNIKLNYWKCNPCSILEETSTTEMVKYDLYSRKEYRLHQNFTILIRNRLKSKHFTGSILSLSPRGLSFGWKDDNSVWRGMLKSTEYSLNC